MGVYDKQGEYHALAFENGEETYSLEYDTYGMYQTLVGTAFMTDVAQYSDAGTVKIYEDEKLWYEFNLNKCSDEFNLEQISLDISKVSRIKIEISGDRIEVKSDDLFMPSYDKLAVGLENLYLSKKADDTVESVLAAVDARLFDSDIDEYDSESDASGWDSDYDSDET